jgi:hypothetical protein
LLRATGAVAITGDTFGAAARDQITDWVTGVIAAAGGEVTGVRVRLESAPGSLTVGQVNLVCFGRALRVQSADLHPEEVGLRLVERLARQVALYSRGWSPRPWPDPLAPPTPDPGPAPRLRRRKSVPPAVMSPAEAVAHLDARDYPAYLFTDATCGLDAVVYRGGPGGYRLARTGPAAPETLSRGALATSPHPAPSLNLEAACARLAEGTEPFLFFTDRAARRGALLYPRYTGGFGLVEGSR